MNLFVCQLSIEPVVLTHKTKHSVSPQSIYSTSTVLFFQSLFFNTTQLHPSEVPHVFTGLLNNKNRKSCSSDNVTMMSSQNLKTHTTATTKTITKLITMIGHTHKMFFFLSLIGSLLIQSFGKGTQQYLRRKTTSLSLIKEKIIC